ncbi:MAG: nucleoside-diphosphate kinase [Nitrospirae bacterium]|nr:nucleoside-diphosphate kinase [Nitrospirota bacterium]
MEQNEEMDQTLVLIKPDALKNSLTGYVLSLLSEFHTGLRFAGAKIVYVSNLLAEEHYAEHRGKIFFPSLLEYIMGQLHYPDEPWKRRVIALVYQGHDAVQKIRDICGPTNPHVAREKKPGCIRALGALVPLKDAEGNVIGERMDNLIHASAVREDAEREIKLWFNPSDIPPFMRTYPAEVNESFYYYRDGRLFLNHEPGSVCLLAPGDIAWKSDLDALRLLSQGSSSTTSLGSVAAKYLMNTEKI